MTDAPPKPLLVSGPEARKIIKCGETKYWKLVKLGKIRLVDTGTGRKMVVYASLEALAQQAA